MTQSAREPQVDNPNHFRVANDQIADTARITSFPANVPFLCECADDACTQVLPLGLDEYETVRAEPARRVTLPGHPTGDGASVVEENERFALVDDLTRDEP